MNKIVSSIQRLRFVRLQVIGQTFFILGLSLSMLPISSFAQAVIYDEFPITAQLYQRDDLNRGAVNIKGKFYTQDYTDVSVIAKKDKKDFYWKKQKLTFQAGEFPYAPFSFQTLISAGLIEYEFYFYAHRGQDSVLIKDASQVLCGDNIVIYGQSNGEANDPTELAKFKDEFKFGRTVFANFETNDYSWFPTMKWNNFFVGMVGLEIQRQLIDKYKMPIGIVNGSVGNKSIDELMIRNESNHEDIQYYYGKLVKKANKVGLSKTARIFIWRQGESEAFEANRAAVYPAKFDKLRKQIYEDFPSIKKIYVFQNNIYWADNNKAGDLRDFQRKIHEIYADCEGFSTIGTPGFDGLHYSYEGYIQNGQELSRLIAKDFMKSTDTLEVHTPNIKKAYLSDNRDELILEFDKNQKMQFPSNGIDKNGGGQVFLKDYIYLDGVAGKVVSGRGEGNKIILKLSEPTTARQVSYCPDNFTLNTEPLNGIPYLTNSRGLRAFTFKNFPISSNIKVQIVSISGYWGSAGLRRVTLSWIPQNNVTYTVEKSVGTDDNFVGIGSISTGTYLDLKVKKGVVYFYRLTVDGVVYSNTILVNDRVVRPSTFLAQDDEMAVYPNPIQQGVDLKVNLTSPVNELILSSSQGNIIQRIQVNSENATISTAKLTPGIYLLEGIGPDNRKIVKKVVID